MGEIITDKQFLRQVSFDTDWGDVGSLNLISRLRDTNSTAWIAGCGLAAVQIGFHLRFAWYRLGEIEHTLMNPKIIEFKGKCKEVKESCLSIPNKSVQVKRWYKIKYLSDGKINTARGFETHIIQHEIDHMDGILNIDK